MKKSIVKIISTPLSNTLPGTELSANTRAQRSEATAAQTPTDTVELQDSASASQAASTDIDMDRVNEVRQALSDGTLQISSARIYEGMAASVMEMNGEQAE